MAQMNLSTEKKKKQQKRQKKNQTHRHGEQTCGCQRGRGREWDELGVWGW